MSEHEAHEEYRRVFMLRTMARMAMAAAMMPIAATAVSCQFMVGCFCRRKDTNNRRAASFHVAFFAAVALPCRRCRGGVNG